MKRPVNGYVWTGKIDYDSGNDNNHRNVTVQRVKRRFKKRWKRQEEKDLNKE